FINTVANHKLPVGHALDSCTKEIQEVRLTWGKERTPVVLVDTPGFGDSSRSDTEVLRLIAKYLVTSRKAGTNLTGLVYMHRISDLKVEVHSRRNFRMFHELCGSNNLTQVVVVTTWWDQVDRETARRREEMLRTSETLFKPMVDYGARMMRHELGSDQGFSSAQAVLNHLLKCNTMDLNIQTQMVKEMRSLPDTSAWEALHTDLLPEYRRCLDGLAFVKEELNRTRDCVRRQALEDERRELQEEKKAIHKQIKSLSKNPNERSVLWRMLSAMGF
ncbi:hypothetical protein BD410DRAFT_729032, partial [Rickenella mellea]